MDDFLRIVNDEYLPLRDVVFKTLRQAIIMGNLEPGERLMEMDLASRMGVSRTPIREAMRMLELEGLVIMVPRCGARVAKISFKNLKDVLEVREALEELAITLACHRITKKQLEELRATSDKFEQTVNEGNEAKIAEADVRFHDIIIEASGNEKLVQMMQNLSEQVYRFRYEYVKDVSIHGELVREHRAMLESIEKKDLQEAVKTVKNHITKQGQAIIRNLNLEEMEKHE